MPKQHFKDVMEVPKELDEGYFTFCQEMAKKIVAVVKADGFNLGMNNGKAAGQIIFHQHTHLIPRFDDDKLESWPHKEVTMEELSALQEKILKA